MVTNPVVGMRWRVTKAVRASGLPSPAKLVMFVLADIANAGTAEIPERFTPSLTVLARETGLGRSTVAAHLCDLERAGWIVRIRPTTAEALGRLERTRYQLKIPPTALSPEPDLVPGEDDPSPELASAGEGLASATEGLASAGAGQPSAAAGQPSAGAGQPSAGAGHRDRSYSDLALTNDLPTSPRKRATRIPDDFAVTPEMVAWAKDRVPRVDGRRETEKFINFWHAKSGKDATKHDWDRTWRNWMLNAAERLPSTNGNGNRSSGANRHIDQLTPEERAARNPFAGAVRASQVASGGTP